ncbi:MAG TPA: hypothetical protein VHV08_08955 [Pirellulales bacterium]|nr:hypothetical protein [Pirellulales bacterium]
MQVERERFEQERREAVERWEKKLSDLEELQAELHRERAALRAGRSATDSDPEPEPDREDAEIAADADPADAPDDGMAEEQTSNRQALSRRSDRSLADETEADEEPEIEEEEADFSGAQTASAPCDSAAMGSAPAGGDEEESIEDYMAALLTRMRGGEAARPAVIQPRPVRAPKPVRAANPRPVIEPQRVEVPPPTETPQVMMASLPGPTEVTRRSRMEETDFAAMRQLANAQARLALHAHSRKQLVNTLLLRVGGAVLCLLAGFFVDRIASDDYSLLVGASMASVVGGIYFLFYAAQDFQRLLKWFESCAASDAAAEATLAILNTDEQPPAVSATGDASRPEPTRKCTAY